MAAGPPPRPPQPRQTGGLHTEVQSPLTTQAGAITGGTPFGRPKTTPSLAGAYAKTLELKMK